jgi:transposase, IS5 family
MRSNGGGLPEEAPMLRVHADQVEMLWDELLPAEARALPADLAQLDALLADPALLAPFRAHFAAEMETHPADPLSRGRPTLSMATYLRLMVIKYRTGWGYETLMREVSDSLHLRRFCLIPLSAPVPDESTVRKLTRRLGPEVTDDLIRGLIAKALRERRFRPRALRADSTVVAADIRYPTDAGLAADAVRVLARAGRQVRAAVPTVSERVRDRSRAVGRRLRELGRSLKRRTGEAKQEVQRLTEEAAGQVRNSLREARRLLATAKRARSRAAGVSPAGRSRALRALEVAVTRAERVVSQVRQRFAGEPIPDRLVSLFDPDARPVRRGKRAQPTEFGYVVQIAEVTASTRRGAPALVLPPKLAAGSTHENALLPDSVAELSCLGIRVTEAVFDGGFVRARTEEALAPVGEPTVFIAGSRENAGSRRTRRRRARFRVGCEGRISHLKRSYGSGRARLKGVEGARIWEGWAVLAYDLDAVRRLPLRRRAAS